MHLHLLDQTYDPDGEANADWIAAAPDMALWLDGAAPFDGRRLFSSPCDAAWFVRRFAEICLALPREGRDAVALVAEAQAATGREYDAALMRAQTPPAERPFACLGLARLVEGCLELVNLGDCSAFVETAWGSARFGYSSVADLDAAALAALQRLRRERGLDHAAAFAEVRPVILENRARRNRMFGYDVIEPAEPGKLRAERMLLPAEPGALLLVMSDGFARAVDLYGLARPEEAIALVRREGAAGVAARVRAIEASDPDATRFPGLKLRDDVSAALFEVRAGEP